MTLDALVLAMMLHAEPDAVRSPWRATYDSTAAAIARASVASPLYAGDDGPGRTAAVLVSIAWFESRFDPRAEGDRPRRADGSLGAATSFCAFQINAANLGWLGVTRERLLEDVDACVAAGLRMARVSLRICRAEPPEHALDWYASGGDGCFRPPRDEGAHRMRKAMWLFATTPRAL